MSDQIKIWSFSDDAFWGIGRTVEEALSDCDEWGWNADDEIEDARLLTDTDLDNTRFYDDPQSQQDSDFRTFREQMQRRIDAGTAKGFFATSEF